jgi:hypothetical protein
MHATYRNNLLGTLLLAVLVLCVVGAVAVIIRRMIADTSYALAAQNAVGLYEHNQRAWDTAKASFAADTDRVNDFSRMIITTDTVPDFLSALETLASAQGVQFSISTVSTNPVAGAPTLSITFSGLGEKARLEAFLLSLEQLPQQLKETAFAFFESTDDATEPDATRTQPLWRVNASIQVLSFTS